MRRRQRACGKRADRSGAGGSASPLPGEPVAAAQPRETSPDDTNQAAASPNVAAGQWAFTESGADIDNPERGFFKFTQLLDAPDLGAVRAAHATVIYAGIRLDAYRDKDLDAALLDGLGAALAQIRAAHLKVVLRFQYNSPGSDPNDSSTADAPVNVITGHLAQLQPVLAANEDVLAVVQAGLIGQWGEWHDSTNGLDNPADRKRVMEALLRAVPASRAVLIRTPAQKRENWGGPLDANAAFGPAAVARIGHHNDCFLASDTDFGTYLTDADKTYLAVESAYVPMAGETCAVNAPRTDCATALADLQAYHWDLLNEDFDLDVLGGWTDQGCMAEVRRRLGYRLVLRSASLSVSRSAAGVASGADEEAPAAKLAYDLTLDNVGFGRLFNARTAYLSLVGPGGRRDVALEGVDPRRWAAGQTATLRGEVDLASLPAGSYRVALWLPDAAPSLRDTADYAVQLANEGTWDADAGFNVLTPQLVVP